MFEKYKAYLQDNPQGYWFRRKIYGWGWIPATWQGWCVTVLYIILVLLFAWTIDDSLPPQEVMFTFFLPILLLTVSLLTIAYKKGEKPRWQWGIPEQKDRDHNNKKQ